MSNVYSISTQYPTDQALQSKLLNDSYGGGTQGFIKENSLGFFRDIDNMKFVRAVMSFYDRDVPAQDNHNHWDDQWLFIKACQYFKKFGMPVDKTQSNCAVFKSLQTAVEQAIEDADKLNATGGESGVVYELKIKVLTDLKDYVNSAFATLQCDFYLSQQEQTQQLSVLNDATTQAIQPTGSAGTNYTNYIIYAVVAIIVIMVLVKIFKH